MKQAAKLQNNNTQTSTAENTLQQPFNNQNAQQPFNNQQAQQPFNNQQVQQPFNNQQVQQPFNNQQAQQPFNNQHAQQPFNNQQAQQPFNNQHAQQHFNNQHAQQHFNNQHAQQHFNNQHAQQPFNNQQAQQQFNIHSAQQQAFQQNIYTPPTANAKQGGSVESVLVKIILPIVFIIVLLIGVIMLFMAGVSYDLVTEPVRILLGVLLAVAMYVVGMLQHSYKRPIWGKSLLGGAHGIFIITVSIAHLSYELIGVALAAALYALAFGLIIFSAVRWRSQLLVTISIVSGYLCMFLIDYTYVNTLSFIIIQLIFSISMILLSYKLNYRIAFGFAYMLLHLSLLITYNVHDYTSHTLMLIALIIQHLVVFIPYMKQKDIHIEQTIVQIIGSLLLISWAAILFNSDSIGLVYSAVTLILAFSYIFTSFYFERIGSQAALDQPLAHSLKLRKQFSIIIAAIALFCFFIEILGTSFFGLIMFLIGVAMILYSIRANHPILAKASYYITLLGTIIIVFDMPSRLLSEEMISWIAMIVIIPIIYFEVKNSLADNERPSNLLPTILWTEAAIIFLFVTNVANLIGNEMNTESASSYMVSLSWLIYAIIAIIIGYVRKLKAARLTGIILLLVIVVKLIFIDMTFLNLLTKSIMFTVLGGIGILVSFILYNRTDEK